MSINETIKSIHRLAVLRDDMPSHDGTSIVLSPFYSGTPANTQEPADAATTWTAQTYRGKGRWGTIMGEGDSPDAALKVLHDGLLHAHIRVDERRAEVLKSAQGVASTQSEA